MRSSRPIVLSIALLLLSCPILHAQESAGGVSGWFKMVKESLGREPVWPVPLVTISPRIEECYRADVRLQPDGSLAQSYGDGKGLSIIPADRFEIIIAPPSYVHHRQPAIQDGFSDTLLFVKYRFLPAEHRSYVLAVQFNAILPTGDHANSAGHAILGPMFLFGKEWGPFNVQGNIGYAIPTTVGGRSVVVNEAFQLHLSRLLWPEVEFTSTKFQDGPNDGKTQTFMTPGLLLGRMPVSRHTAIAFGAGVQIAVTEFRTYNHAVLLSARVLFPEFKPSAPPKVVF